VSRSSTRSSSSSFSAAARGVAGVFGTCFVPRVRKDETEEPSRGSRSGGFSQGSRGAGVHVSTDSGTISRSSPSALLNNLYGQLCQLHSCQACPSFSLSIR
jgi:hypothetical protein